MGIVVGRPGRRRLGLAAAVAGALVLIFVAYQWWGSSLVEEQRQALLRNQLTGELTGRHLLPATGGHGRAAVLPGASGPPVTAPDLPQTDLGQPVATLQIPTIGLDQVVVQGAGPAELASGPGHYPGTPLPGQAGNAAIAGHRTTHGHPFYDLQALVDGDDVVVTTVQGVFVYVVVDSTVVDPSDTAVLSPTATPMLTLTTCNPRFSAAQRLVVRAALEQSALFADPAPGPTVPMGRTARSRSPGDLGPGPLSGQGWPGLAAWLGLLVVTGVGTVVGARRVRPRWAAYAAGAPLLALAVTGLIVQLDTLLPPGL
jgi:sortase A